MCIILKPIVAYLVGREHVFPTGCAFVCGSASFKFSFIPALLPTLWPIISCNIGHPRLCEAPAPFAFLIHMEHSWSDCRYGGGKLGGEVASEVKAKLLSLLMKGWGQSGYMLKRIRVFSQWWEDETPIDSGCRYPLSLLFFMVQKRKKFSHCICTYCNMSNSKK